MICCDWPSAAPTSPPTAPRSPPPATASSLTPPKTPTCELVTLAETIEKWRDGIETYLTTGITNAASEGGNRLIKREARNALGFRNRTRKLLVSQRERNLGMNEIPFRVDP